MTQQIAYGVVAVPIIKYCIYARKSMEAEERQALSIESQLNEMRLIAERDNLTIVDIKTEAHSAKQSGQRTVFLEMINDLKTGKYNAILTWNPDRLSRNAGDLGHLVDLMDKGLLLSIRTFNQSFTNSPNDKFLLMILCSQAKLENDNRGINVKRGLRASVEKGLWPCSAVPIGYLKSNIVNEEGVVLVDHERAPIIKQIFEKVAYEKYSIYDVLKWLKEIGFNKRSGKELLYGLIQIMLHNPFYYGWFEYPRKSGNLYKGAHEAIITKELFDEVQEKIDQYNRKKKYHKSKTSPFSFLAMIRCGTCGSNISAEEKYKTLKVSKEDVVYRYYTCNRSRDRACRERYINEKQLMSELYKILDTVDLDLIGMRALFDLEIEKWYKVRAFVQNKPPEERSTEKKEYDLRNYAKIILEEGRIDEQREVLKHLTGRLILKDKKIYLDTAPKSETLA